MQTQTTAATLAAPQRIWQSEDQATLAPRAEELARHIGKAFDVAKDSHAPRTLKEYARRWKIWCDYCTGHGLAPAPPVDVTVLTGYLAWRANEDGELRPGEAPMSAASVRLDATAIAFYHREQNLTPPTSHKKVQKFLRGLKRGRVRRGERQGQKDAFTPEMLDTIRQTAREPREFASGLESVAVADRRGLKEIALISVLLNGGLRVSEAQNLEWSDLEIDWQDQSATATVWKSKADQDANGREVYLPPRCVEDLLAMPKEDPHFVFCNRKGERCDVRTLQRFVERACEYAGLDANLSAHSGRIGMARYLISRGASLDQAARQGGWGSVNMVAVYTRRESARSIAKFYD